MMCLLHFVKSIFPSPQSRNWLLGLQQDVWALRMKNVLGDQLKWQFQKALLAETLTIYWERVGNIIHEILDMRNVSAKWVPKCFNANQKHDQSAQDILDQFLQDPVGFCNCFLTVDETWIHTYCDVFWKACVWGSVSAATNMELHWYPAWWHICLQ
jgi:hypothetical protein